MCSTHFTLSCRILFFSLPTTNNFFKFVYSEITWESAWHVLFRHLFCGNWRSSKLDSFQFWTSDIQDLPTSWRKFLYFALFVISVLYTKNALQSTQFSRYSTTFFRLFYSFLQNWVITEVLVCPVYILYEFIVVDNSIRPLYFHVCFPVFPLFVYICCIMDSTCHSHKSCPSALAPLRHHSSGTLTFLFFKRLPSHARSRGMPVLALLVPQILMFLSNNVWANLTVIEICLDRCEEKLVWKLWGHWTSRRSRLFMWTSCGYVTVQTFTVAIIRDIRKCIHI